MPSVATDSPSYVSTHSRLKAAGTDNQTDIVGFAVSTHSRLKAAGVKLTFPDCDPMVSTHSRLKAAGA